MEQLSIHYMVRLMNSILEARENRANQINQLVSIHQTVVSVKANIPGPNKNVVSAGLLVSIFSRLLSAHFKKEPVLHQSEDGPFSIFTIEQNAEGIKKEMTEIEETHPLGRLIDIDVYSLNQEHHRDKPRQCFICNETAFICARKDSHSVQEYLSKINQLVIEYVVHQLSYFIDISMMDELNLHPKFGLVTKYSQGSHKDMDYSLMVCAKEAIIPFLIKIFDYTYHSNEPEGFVLFHVQAIGMAAEKAMLESTKNINAYKGLVYHLGYVLYALAKVIKKQEPLEAVFARLMEANPGFEEHILKAPDSFGKRIYLEKGIGGARKEMSEGLPHVKQAMKLLDQYDRLSFYKVLKYLIINTEDTTLYKRVGISEAEKIKKRFIDLNVSDDSEIQRLTDECIQLSCSFGGSADLLVVTLFLKRVEELLFTI